MLGPSAGTLRCFRSDQERHLVADLVSNMVSGDLAGAEDRGLVAARNEALRLILLRNAASDALGSDLAIDSELRPLSQ